MSDKVIKFWETKRLEQLSLDEWELLCDGCGLCCLQKLEDAEDGSIYYTRIACKLLDLHTCRCQSYKMRKQYVPNCVQLTLDNTQSFSWLPETCAYKRLFQGQKLPEWHPLLTGDYNSVKQAGISMAGKLISETQVSEDSWEDYLIFRVD